MSQHGYMRHTATPPLVLDLIRLIQSGSCGTKPLIHLLPFLSDRTYDDD